MRETRADTAQAVVLAIGLHALLLAVLFFGMWFSSSREQVSAAGSPISAELIDATALSEAMQQTLEDRPEPAVEPVPEPQPEPVPEDAAPLPQPVPEPVPEDAPTPPQAAPQEFLPDPDTENRDAVTDQPTPTPTDERELQEERRRQEQVDLTQQRRQQEAERQRRLSEMERERQQQLADIRRRREAAAREAAQAQAQLEKIAEARARSAAEAAASAPAGNNGTDTGLQAQYAAALQQAILSKWTRPETVPIGAVCRLTIRQLPGGEVMSAEVSSPCAYDEQGRRSIGAAVLKAQPLPYAGFESVFQRNLTLNFRAEDR